MAEKTPMTPEMRAALAGKTQSAATNAAIQQVRAATLGGPALPKSRPDPVSTPLPRQDKPVAVTWGDRYGRK